VTSLRVESSADLRSQVARALVMGGIDLVRIDRGAGRLEDIFLQLTRNKDVPPVNPQ
jgi:ABC-2 type transport system ATP-binding protein